jgi:predicted RNase H-like nuclease
MEVGVDGCRNGWAAVFIEGGKASGDLFRSFAALAESYQTASLILIDMPIGLRQAMLRPGRPWPTHAA